MPSPVVTKARKLLENTLDFAGFLEKLPPKDRANAERRVTTLEAANAADRAILWKKLCGTLITLAPTVKLVGAQTVQFYIPDGKYRMQVFALEDLQDGNLTVYCPNQLPAALEGAAVKAVAGHANTYAAKGAADAIVIEQLDGSTPNPPDHMKDLVGWNRKAIKIVLPPGASAAQTDTAVLLCAIAATNFPKPKPEAPKPDARQLHCFNG